MNPTLQIADRRTMVQMRQGATVGVTQRPTTLEVTVGGQKLELPIRRTAIEIRKPLVLDVPVRRMALEFTSPGVQGPPGPSQFVIGTTAQEPAPIDGYPILFFETGLTSDPDDVVPSVIKYP